MLIHWGWDKMAFILQILLIFQLIFLNENFKISNDISLKYVPYGLVDNMSSLVQIMAWRQAGNCQRCSSYIFILLNISFNVLGKDNCKMRRETFKFGNLVQLILEVLPYMSECYEFSYVWISIVNYHIFNMTAWGKSSACNSTISDDAVMGSVGFRWIITHAPVHINDFRGVRARYVKRTG